MNKREVLGYNSYIAPSAFHFNYLNSCRGKKTIEKCACEIDILHNFFIRNTEDKLSYVLSLATMSNATE